MRTVWLSAFVLALVCGCTQDAPSDPYIDVQQSVGLPFELYEVVVPAGTDFGSTGKGVPMLFELQNGCIVTRPPDGGAAWKMAGFPVGSTWDEAAKRLDIRSDYGEATIDLSGGSILAEAGLLWSGFEVRNLNTGSDSCPTEVEFILFVR